MSKGILQPDMWGVTPTDRWDWAQLRADIAVRAALGGRVCMQAGRGAAGLRMGESTSVAARQSSAAWLTVGPPCFLARLQANGVRNSLLVAPMPTASTSQILGNNECFEPYTSNIYVRRVLSGEQPLAAAAQAACRPRWVEQAAGFKQLDSYPMAGLACRAPRSCSQGSTVSQAVMRAVSAAGSRRRVRHPEPAPDGRPDPPGPVGRRHEERAGGGQRQRAGGWVVRARRQTAVCPLRDSAPCTAPCTQQ